LCAAAALATLLGAPAAASADPDRLLVRRMQFSERGKHLVVSASFTELFDQQSFDQLPSGLATTVLLRIYVYRRNRELPVALTVATFRVVYDLWDEVYTVRVEGPLGSRTRRFRRRAQALKAITELEDFPIASLDRIEVGPHYFLAMVVELNPVSPELLAEVRRWLSRPAGDRRLETSSSFFGSFVSVFSNPKLPEADAVLKLQSQPFYRVD
jgi:hypothetical protein